MWFICAQLSSTLTHSPSHPHTLTHTLIYIHFQSNIHFTYYPARISCPRSVSRKRAQHTLRRCTRCTQLKVTSCVADVPVRRCTIVHNSHHPKSQSCVAGHCCLALFWQQFNATDGNNTVCCVARVLFMQWPSKFDSSKKENKHEWQKERERESAGNKTKPSSWHRFECVWAALIENPLWHFNCFHYASIQMCM